MCITKYTQFRLKFVTLKNIDKNKILLSIKLYFGCSSEYLSFFSFVNLPQDVKPIL